MAEILPSKFFAALESLARKYLPSLEAIEVVPDIQEWCRAHAVPEDNPFRIGKCLRNDQTGRFRILLSEPITQDMKNSLLTAMRVRGLAEEASILADDRLFLHHLLLHEIAHAINASYGENQCDKWAFDKLATMQSNISLQPSTEDGAG